MVDICAVKPWKRPVTLDAIKADPRLTKLALVTNSRLSAQLVSDVEWNIFRAEGALL
jgi:predicted RNA-binding protein with PUA-like domain